MTNDTINTHPDTLAARQNINNLPENGTDFVAEGCDLTLEGDELTVSRGVLVLSHDETLYRVTVAARSGDDVLDVPADSQLGVYYDVVPNEVVVQASAPAEPMLQIGSVDTAAGTTTFTNRRPDQTVGSLKADSLVTEARGPRVTVHVKGDGTIVANGPNSELASGDVTAPDDVRRVIQTAINEGGEVSIKRHSSPYTMTVGGQDADGVDYCLSMAGSTTLEIEAGATLEYPASNTGDDGATPDVATVILCSGVDNWEICGVGTVDGGAHPTTQSGADISAMGIRVGLKEATTGNDYSATACTQFAIRGITVTGAFRHGIEVANESERFVVEDVLADDGSGDDDFAVGGPAKHGSFKSCFSINKRREGNWTASSYELDDGPENISFIDCHAINTDGFPGFQLGKTHAYADTEREYNQNHKAIGCTAIGCNQGFYTFVASGESSNITYQNCHAEDCMRGYTLQAGSSGTIRNWELSSCTAEGNDTNVRIDGEGTFEDLKIRGGEYNTTTSNSVNINFIPDGPVTDFRLDGVLLRGGDPANFKGIVEGSLENLTFDGVINRDGNIVVNNKASIDQLLFKDMLSERSSASHIDLNPTTGQVCSGLRIEGCVFKGSFAPIRVGGTSSEYNGGIIRNNEVYGTNTAFDFGNTNIRSEVRTLWNTGNDDDPSPEVPANPDSGMRYIDDGTNTTTETLRVYLGGGWRAMASA